MRLQHRGLDTLAPVSIPGADAAMLGCGDGCEALASVGGSMFSLYTSSSTDPAVLIAAVTALIPAIVAAG
ncbi:MAG: hypothetical protein ABJB03_00305 [Rhodoglobus sp.]